jgi:tripartite-type tricarboxylate transporter receptor subunit TctC
MQTNELQNQLKLKQAELNYAHDADTKKRIEKQISVLRLKLEIEQIRDRIKYLNQH